MLSFPPFRIDLADERLWRDGREVPLRRKPFAILRYLAENPHRLVTQEELVAAVWGNVAMSESLVRTHVHALRNAIGAGIIDTVVGRGYRFVAEVVDAEDPAFASEPRASARESILVGRDDALEALRAAWKEVLGGERRTIFVVGEPGIGKTAVAETFLAEVAQGRSVWIARGFCVEQYGSGEAYLPVLDAIGSFARSQVAPHLTKVLGRCAPTWLAQMPSLLSNEEFEELQSRVSSPNQFRMLRELAEALDVLTREKPLVLLLEDLQWADHSTAELLGMLGRRREPARLLILATCRDTEIERADPVGRLVGELEAHRQAEVVRLEGLSESAVEDYLSRRFADHALPAELAARIREPTGGNPLFLVGLVGDLERRQLLKMIEGRWRLTIPVREVAALRPESVRRLIDIQIDRLTPAEQRVLEGASAVGAIFTAAVVAFALQLETDEVEATCEALANERHFLRAMGTEIWPDGSVQYRYGFVHAMHQDAALARSRSASVRSWHRRVGELLEAAHRADPEKIAAELAIHFDEGHAFEKAARYYAAAGERAVRRSGYASALRQVERARELVGRLPAGRERDVLELRVLRSFADVSLVTDADAHRRLDPILVRAVELATQLRDDQSLAAVLFALQNCRLRGEHIRAASDKAEEAWAVAKRLADPMRLAEAAVMSSYMAMLAGELIHARDILDGLVSTLEHQEPTWHGAHTGNPDNPAINGRCNRAFLAWLLGYPDDALARVKRAVECARALDDTYSLVVSLAVQAIIQMLRGDARAVLESIEGMAAFAEEGAIYASGDASASRAVAAWSLSIVDPPACEALIDGLAPPSGWARVFFTLPIAEVLTRTGRHQRALEEVAAAQRDARDAGLRVYEPELLRLRGVLLASSDRKEALRSLEEAIELTRSQSSKSFELRAAMSLCRLQRGKSRARTLGEIRRLYESFTEGFDTRDLLDAKAILGAPATSGRTERRGRRRA